MPQKKKTRQSVYLRNPIRVLFCMKLNLTCFSDFPSLGAGLKREHGAAAGSNEPGYNRRARPGSTNCGPQPA
jgi:hypothetical protein